MQVVRVLVVSTACVLALAGCESWSKWNERNTAQTQADPAAPSDPTPTGSVTADKADPSGFFTKPTARAAAVNDALLGSDPSDDLSLGKRHYKEQNYGLAEKHYRRAVEKLPSDGEAWLGLAASYDRLRRFDLADRAYGEALRVLGPLPEVLNNQGYSYLLRGDHRRARAKLAEAQAKDPDNPYIQNNLVLVEVSERKAKGLR
jgi:Flp pilus assembly protein TadD